MMKYLKKKDNSVPFFVILQPLVQMSRTLIFMWVFTLPLALANDIEKPLPLLFVIFFLTFGFIGLELVSIEMDDPYGLDANDFNVRGLAKVSYFYYLLCYQIFHS